MEVEVEMEDLEMEDLEMLISDLYIIVAGEVHLGVCFSFWRGPLQYKRGLILLKVTSKSSKMRPPKSLSESHYFLKKKSQKITFLRVNRLRYFSWYQGWYFVSEIGTFGQKEAVICTFGRFLTLFGRVCV